MKITNTNTNNNNNNKYIPPTNNQAKHMQSKQLQLQEKQLQEKQLQVKQLQLNKEEEFPTLLLVSKNNNNKNKKGQPQAASSSSSPKQPVFSFASALNNEKIKEEDTVQHSSSNAANEETDDPAPGWVAIKRIDGKINYKYGKMTDAYTSMLLAKQKYERRLEKIYFKRRLDQLQYERDILNDLLGDLSPYWGVKPLNEIYKKLEPLNTSSCSLINNEEENEDEIKEISWIYV